MKVRLVLLLLLCVVPAVCRAAESTPRDLFNSLNALRLDSQNVYTVAPDDRINLHQGDSVISLMEGKIAFFEPFEERITGFVFSGLGQVVALPRDPAEKQQMARFLGAPILDQRFISGYLRFTDDTAQDLLAQLHRASLKPVADPSFAALWRTNIERLNPTHSLRILFEKYSSVTRHFFHASLDGVVTGPFDILIDQMRQESLMIGQARRANNISYYDVWTSYSLADFPPPKTPFDALHYRIDTSIHSDNSLEGDTSVEFRANTGTEQVVFIGLARALRIESVSQESGEALPFFQNEGLTGQELRTRGDDTLCVFLPKPPRPGDPFTLRFRYRGGVIEDAGNGVLYVGSRESWYPHYGDSSKFALYDLTLRWPRRLRLVATGTKLDEQESGESRVGHWKTEQPVSEAGFNLGEYVVASVPSGDYTVDVYANKQLENAVLARLARSGLEFDPRAHPSIERGAIPMAGLSPPTPTPADALKQLAREIDSSLHFYERFSGPFPFHRLGVSQIPGSFGQGWPGLLYLSTISFLPEEAQQRVGLDTTGRELFTDIVPFHEAAHQWWGNVVGWSSYRDQWIDESIASYLAVLFADSQKNRDRTLRVWLDRYRKHLTTKPPETDLAPADVGPLIMGVRLSSSKSPNGYDDVIYSKGIWILHMLHLMLRQPNSPNPDARFITLLHTLVSRYGQHALSTAQFQREVESVMTPRMDLEGGHSMDWFFEEYVRGTGIPHYKVEFSSRRTDKGFQVRGKLLQSRVPRGFIAPVPLYVALGAGKSAFLGTVLATGEETSFSFASQTDPHKLLIDPHMTLLCVPE